MARITLSIALCVMLAACSGGAASILPEHAQQVLSGTPASSSTPAPVVETAPDTSAPEWLTRVNQFRTMAGLDPITANNKMSDDDTAHARYLVKNYSAGKSPSLEMHSESRGNQWYTAEGYAAARTSDIIPPGGIELTDRQAIDLWIAGPFHRFPILNPKLTEAGFGSFDEDGVSAIAMQLRKPNALEDPNAPSPTHRSMIREESSTDTETDTTNQRVVQFPPPNSTFPLAAFSSTELPNPLASCPGYVTPTGFPITLQLGGTASVKLDSASVTSDGQPIESCAFDSASYRASDEAQTYTGRAVLTSFGAVVLIPKERLHSGKTYNVAIVANGKPYNWTFAIGNHGQRQ
ncbi:MAG TPA: CAP domain-containing protein [Candidatus Binataceae bacterium]|nr:CAP domain-containing protein [Candidatus Binataceae bacterium]